MKITVGMLREAFGNAGNEEINKIIHGRNDEEEINLIDVNQYVAVKAWTTDDVISQLVEREIEYDEEILCDILNHESLSRLSDCTDQEWGFIDRAIDDVVSMMQKGA